MKARKKESLPGEDEGGGIATEEKAGGDKTPPGQPVDHAGNGGSRRGQGLTLGKQLEIVRFAQTCPPGANVNKMILLKFSETLSHRKSFQVCRF